MICRAVQEGDYARFAAGLRRVAIDERTPVNGTLELTARCNLSCNHCYIVSKESTGDEGSYELSRREWEVIFGKLAKAGCLWLGLTGGEPMAHGDFLALYENARRTGFLITVMTNGTLISDDVASLFSQLPPLAVEVTMYGATESAYRRVTGSAQAYGAALAGVERLVNRRVHTVLKMTVTRQNIEQFPAIKAIAREFDVPFRFDGLLNSALDGTRDAIAYRLGADELVSLEAIDPRVKRAWIERQDHVARYESGLVYDCGAGRNTFHVDWRGGLTPCIMVREPRFDILNGSFDSAWESEIATLAQKTMNAHAKCSNCSLIGFCDTCAGWGMMEAGDPEAPTEYLCRVARERSLKFAAEPWQETL